MTVHELLNDPLRSVFSVPLFYVLNFRVDAFAVKSDKNLGNITKIHVGHDNKGFAAAWYLSKVSDEHTFVPLGKASS